MHSPTSGIVRALAVLVSIALLLAGYSALERQATAKTFGAIGYHPDSGSLYAFFSAYAKNGMTPDAVESAMPPNATIDRFISPAGSDSSLLERYTYGTWPGAVEAWAYFDSTGLTDLYAGDVPTTYHSRPVDRAAARAWLAGRRR